MAILVQSNKKPSVSFPSQTGSIVTFNSQYAGLPLKSHTVDIDSVSGVSEIIIGNCDSTTAQLWTIDNSFNGDVEFNQLVQNGNFADTSNWSSDNGNFSVNNNEAILEATTNFAQIYQTSVKFNINHVYLLSFDAKSDTEGIKFGIGSSTFGYELRIISSSYETYSRLLKPGPNPSKALILLSNNSHNEDIIYVKNVMTFDLTQMFGSTIADYIYNLEQGEAGAGVSFFKHIYPDNYYPYNTGTKQGVGTYTTINIGQTVNEGEYNARTGVLEVTQPSVQTLQLPPCPIETLQGENNLFASTGETTVEFIKIGG